MIGTVVKNNDKQDIGKIEEIVLDKITGHARYVVLSFGGFLGLGDKFFAFAWKSISYCKETKIFILNVDKDKLKQEAGFDKNCWPDLATWEETLADYYEHF